jgi:hypothetical protein
LHAWRWAFRVVGALAVVAGIRAAFAVRLRWRWVPALAMLLSAGAAWAFNGVMAADRIFKQPPHVVLKPRLENRVDESSTYCSVCRSRRVFEPLVSGRLETFRLVGMDHFNAMFEDNRTGSWWRQATGTAVAGPLMGTRLPEVTSVQLTLRQSTHGRFERGESTGSLTRTDPGSWNDKSWIVGVETGGVSKAYDWNRLKSDRVINDVVAGTPIVVALAQDEQGFVAFERPALSADFRVEGDQLRPGNKSPGRSSALSHRVRSPDEGQSDHHANSTRGWHSDGGAAGRGSGFTRPCPRAGTRPG